MTLAQQRAALDKVMRKATNVPKPADALAARLAHAAAVDPHDAMLIKAAMRAVAPFIKALQDEIAELQERLDALEAKR